jgi:hypothetical protein
MTVQEYVARVTERKAEDLLAAAHAVMQDSQSWKPLGRGRTVIDLVAECAITNRMSIKLLHERAWDEAGREERRQAHAALDTLDKASASLRENTRALAAAIRALPDDQLALEIRLPDETSTVAEDLLHPYWNMAYHEGQINYIQTLEDQTLEEARPKGEQH